VANADHNLKFINSTPADAREMFYSLYSLVGNDGDAYRELRYMLQRLATRPEMSDAWVELTHFQKITPSELVIHTFLVWAYTTGGVGKRLGAGFATGLTAFELATQARTVANEMRAFIGEDDITRTTLAELERTATFFEREWGYHKALIWKLARAPRKARARNAHEVAFVDAMCDDPDFQSIGRRPRRAYKLIAILVNVAFDVPQDKLWDPDRVKHCYRSRSKAREHLEVFRTIKPSNVP
jgi:hypothetical protein